MFRFFRRKFLFFILSIYFLLLIFFIFFGNFFWNFQFILFKSFFLHFFWFFEMFSELCDFWKCLECLDLFCIVWDFLDFFLGYYMVLLKVMKVPTEHQMAKISTTSKNSFFCPKGKKNLGQRLKTSAGAGCTFKYYSKTQT